MPFLDTLRIALAGLRQQPLRTGLSTLGVIVGVGALVAVLSLGDGMERFARRQVAETTSLQVASVLPRTTVRLDGIWVPVPDPIRLRAADVRDAHAQVPGLVWGALQQTGGLLVRDRHGRERGVTVTGVAAAGTDFPTQPVMAAGAFLTLEQMQDTLPLVAISAGLAGILGGLEVGDSVRLGEVHWQVAGLVRDTSLAAWIPHDRAEEAMGPAGNPRTSTMLLAAGGIEDAARLRERALAWAGARWPDGATRIEVQTQEARLLQVSRGVLIMKIFLGALAGISLVVGGIGIMNILLAAVAERTREIGIRRAAGARQRDVLLQFLAESIAISTAGSVLGAALGVGTAFAVTAVMRARTEALVHASLSPSTLAIAIGAGLAIGLTFGMFPALRASRLTPVDAIRHE